MTIDLRYGDTIEQMKLIPDKSIDAIICDLPYGTTACKWDTIIPFGKLWEQYERIIKDNGAIILTASQPFTSALVMSNPKLFKYEWIWEKNVASNFMQYKFMVAKKHENVLIFAKGKTKYNPIMEDKCELSIQRMKYKFKNRKQSEHYKTDISEDRSDRQEKMYPTSVKKFNREVGLHPTQKPISMMEYFVLTYTDENDTILDNTFGSCTTGIACINTNRNFIGIENNMDYFNISLKRVEEKRKEKDFNLITSFGDGM
jgi:site-specific DNA-methyltransferase (adenine-specific)